MKKIFKMLLLILLAAACFLTFTVCGQSSSKAVFNDGCMIVAHRGGASLGPENTLSCMEKGIAAGADIIETDLHMTADGHIVVCHDPTVNRTTDGNGAIRNMTLDEVRSLHIVYNKSVTDERIPTLEEVLDLVKGKAVLLLEIKKKRGWYEGIEQKTLEMLREKGFTPEEIILQSFDDSVLETFHSLGCEYPLEKLLFFKFPGLPICFDMGLTKFTLEKYNYVQSLNFHYKFLTNNLIDYYHSKGFKVGAWTVPQPEKLKLSNLDRIITNYPQLYR